MAQSFPLKNGTILLSTEAPGGLYNASQLQKIAEICTAETAVVKATEDQRLALFVKAEEASQVAAELKAVGLGIRHYQDGIHQPVACIGALCPENTQDALKSAMQLSKSLASLSADSPLKIGINGCSRCCVPSHTYDISIIGEAEGYRLSLGGKGSQIPEMAAFMAERIPPAELPALIVAIVTLFKEHAEAGESLQDVIARCGASSFVKALSPYSQDAAVQEANGTEESAEESMSQEDPTLSSQTLEDDLTDDNLSNDLPDSLDDELGDLSSLSADMDIDPSSLGEEGTELSTEVPIADSADGDLDLADVSAFETDSDLEMPPATVANDSLDDPDFEDLEKLEVVSDLGELTEVEAEAEPASVSNSELEDEENQLGEVGESLQEEKIAKGIDQDLNIDPLEDPEEDAIVAERNSALEIVHDKIEHDTAESDLDSISDLEIEEETVTPINTKSPNKPNSAPVTKVSPQSSGFEVSGIDLSPSGDLRISFASGAKLGLNLAKLGSQGKSLNIGGKDVTVRSDAEGVTLSIDELEIFYPAKNAA